MHIAIVEDDPVQRLPITNWLQEAGHECSCFESGEAFVDGLQQHNHQLLILDWQLPGKSGVELLTWLRTNVGNTLPIIFLTSRDSEEDIVQALSKGADDYLVKPARKSEFLARIGAVARRAQLPSLGTTQQFGNISIDTRRHQLSMDGVVIELTQKEYTLINFLLQNCGKLVSRSALLEDVWGRNDKVNTRTVDTHISRLRKKLQLHPENGWQLSAIYQYGYRLDNLNADTASGTAAAQ